RPETEELVSLVLAELALKNVPRCLELGTGSGAIAVSLALEWPGASVVATDVSPSALAVAKNNAQTLRANIDFRAGSWYAPLATDERFDLIVSNPPYVAAGDSHLQGDGLRFEPMLALSDGGDGLGCIREIVAGARAHLVSGGSLWFEHGYDQGLASRNLLLAAGFEAVSTYQDFAGHDRVSGGRLFFRGVSDV
ncbi:MAG TPA: HemK/PrmC family methyltransferase, partial [Rhodocyclaceae bacterium]|nr:HemK/PrmC family methyltransferase [Rhodocyclaceae bacterium]